MKQRVAEWAAGVDANKKDMAKVAGKAVVRLLDLSSRILFQLPHEKDNPIVKGVKCVALVDSVYKALIKSDDDEDKKEETEESTPVDPEEVVPEKRRILLLEPPSNEEV